MALLEKQLVVKTSTIPNAGRGLFTTKAIPKGTRIVEYKGRITVWKEVKDQSDNGYIYSVNKNHVIDAKNSLKALARFANDASGLTRVKGIVNNCIYVNDGLRPFIESTRDIPAGGEILVAYGKEYWDVVRINIREAKEAEKKAAAKEKQKAQAAAKKEAALKKKAAAKKKAPAKKGEAAKKGTEPRKRAKTTTSSKRKAA